MSCIKYAIGTTLAGAIAVAAVSSASAQYYYSPGYYPGYAYVYEPSYAIAPAPATYAVPADGYAYVYAPPPACWNSTSDSRNFGYYGSCAYGALDTDPSLGQARPNRRLVR